MGMGIVRMRWWEASKDDSLPVRGAGYEPGFDFVVLTDF